MTHCVLSTLAYSVNCFWRTVCFCSFVSSLQLKKLKENFLWVIRIEDKGQQSAVHATAINLTLPSPHHAM